MFGVVVFIFLVFESVEPRCIDYYTQLISSPISSRLIRENILKIPPQYYANCSTVTSVNLNAEGNDVKLNSLDFVKYFPSSVITLDASNNEIIELPRLINAVQLKTIDLRRNKIEDITYISEYRYLQYIDFSENKIKTLPEITLPNLTRLFLRTNLLKSIEPWNLRASPNIVTLQLDENLLTELRLCEFKNKIFISIANNPNFSCNNVVCNMCICTIIGDREKKDERKEYERDIDVCSGLTEINLYIIVTVVVALFCVIGLTCLIIRWKRRTNRRIREESQDHNPLSMNSMPMTSITPPPQYELHNYQNGHVLDENPHGNIPNYDYVYDHFRKKRHIKPHQQNSPW